MQPPQRLLPRFVIVSDSSASLRITKSNPCNPRLKKILALLMGTVALFVLLAVVMFVTRKVDWYARDVD